MGLLLAIAVMLAACASDEPDPTEPGDDPPDGEEGAEGTDTPEDPDDASSTLVADAIEEGALTIYTAQGPSAADTTLDAFMEAYPEIAAEQLRLGSNPLASRFQSEADANVHLADAYVTVAPDVFDVTPELFKEVTVDLVPNVADWPEQHVAERRVETGFATQLITYNTDTVSADDLPTDWADLNDADLSNAVILDPRSSPVFMSWYMFMLDQYGEDWLEQLGASGATFTDSGVTAAQEVAAGAYTMAIPTVPVHTSDLREQGAPVEIHEVAPAHGYSTMIGIAENAPNPNAARLFMHWFLSQTAQEINCEGAIASVGFPDLAECATLPADYVEATPSVDMDPAVEQQVVTLLGLE